MGPAGVTDTDGDCPTTPPTVAVAGTVAVTVTPTVALAVTVAVTDVAAGVAAPLPPGEEEDGGVALGLGDEGMPVAALPAGLGDGDAPRTATGLGDSADPALAVAMCHGETVAMAVAETPEASADAVALDGVWEALASLVAAPLGVSTGSGPEEGVKVGFPPEVGAPAAVLEALTATVALTLTPAAALRLLLTTSPAGCEGAGDNRAVVAGVAVPTLLPVPVLVAVAVAVARTAPPPSMLGPWLYEAASPMTAAPLLLETDREQDRDGVVLVADRVGEAVGVRDGDPVAPSSNWDWQGEGEVLGPTGARDGDAPPRDREELNVALSALGVRLRVREPEGTLGLGVGVGVGVGVGLGLELELRLRLRTTAASAVGTRGCCCTMGITTTSINIAIRVGVWGMVLPSEESTQATRARGGFGWGVVGSTKPTVVGFGPQVWSSPYRRPP